MRLIIEINESKDAGGIFINGDTQGAETGTKREKEFTWMLIQLVEAFAEKMAAANGEAKIAESTKS